jgi:hypothetical protein
MTLSPPEMVNKSKDVKLKVEERVRSGGMGLPNPQRWFRLYGSVQCHIELYRQFRLVIPVDLK